MRRPHLSLFLHIQHAPADYDKVSPPPLKVEIDMNSNQAYGPVDQ